MTVRDRIIGAFVLLLACGCTSTAPVAGQNGLPPDAESALERLNSSPRHAEWAVVRTGDGDSVRVFVVYPETSQPAPVVLVAHEIYGLTSWVRGVADQLAADGFIAIAPDLLTMKDVPVGEDGEPDRQQATQQIRSLDVADVHRQLSAVAEWGMALPAATDSYGIVGYCWGGSTSFRHAVESDDVDAAVVYYGSSPDTTLLGRIAAPVLGLYGGDDERVNATIPAAKRALDALGRTYDVHIFEGAGHGFLRQQNGRDGANMEATRQAWPLTIEFFRKHLN
ncbi:MAG: dienelactone hydrolase family protein [Candidatus Cloacimonetes bacterium]|nr:dienelactone hydrolase family protein [Candidatus Cloacimonadota bacterium]